MILSEKHGVNEILYQLFKAAVVRGGNSRLVTWTRVVKTHVFSVTWLVACKEDSKNKSQDPTDLIPVFES